MNSGHSASAHEVSYNFVQAQGESHLCPPAFRIPILRRKILSAEECQLIRDQILEKESEITSQHTSTPIAGLTSGLTTLWSHYNVLTWSVPEQVGLKQRLFDVYREYLQLSEVQPFKNQIQCWANALRKGAGLERHLHSNRPITAISGHLALNTTSAATLYHFPFVMKCSQTQTETYCLKLESEEGWVTFFPSWVQHSTMPYQEDGIRVTMAFDILAEIAKGSPIPFDTGN
ncbi:hypothetical protein A11Q_2453 [Pseudobdellovibrio exovorus JSS]|uniref:Aspartyl/asparaginy/proline hydroxylase domain-containing protein n=2 Tax=Pseudobdellovibrio exovorus TaxID=453816 RepID=M4VTY1_9BACT|nr:hypothetical protein A11Q_2453 [Pseudobdellovibrio exovorus JSS]